MKKIYLSKKIYNFFHLIQITTESEWGGIYKHLDRFTGRHS